MADEVITKLHSISGLRIECPGCGSEFPFKRAKAFDMYEKYPPSADEIIASRIQGVAETLADIATRRKELAENRKRKPERITVSTEATVFGQIGEHIFPALTSFPYKRDECRVLLKPVDYVVFAGLSAHARVDEIRFVEAKTGGGTLTAGQRQVRDRISEGKVRHRVIE